MRIRRKAQLVERAEIHRDADRFTASFYVGEVDGAEFKGCEIGCLATPHQEAARLRFFDRFRDRTRRWREVEIPTAVMVRRIERDFGVCEGLQRVAEQLLFSYDEGPQRLGGFVVRFVKALPEGVDVDNERVVAWCESRGGAWDASVDAQDLSGMRFGAECIGPDGTVEAEAFLSWLRRGAPRPRRKAVAAA